MPTAPPDEQLRQIIDARTTARELVKRRVLNEAQRILDPFDAWASDRLVADMAAELYDGVETGQRAVAGITDAYLARASTVLAGQAVSVAGTLRGGEYPLRGTPGPEVYARLAGSYRYARARNADADKITMFRADAMIQGDLQHAGLRQARKFYQQKGYKKARRVIRPEQALTGTCGLCYAASDRVYSTTVLMPVHERCNCDSLPIIGQNDPIAYDVDLGDVYGEAGSTAGRDLKKVRYQIVEHSELGPQLRVKGHNTRNA